MNLTLATLVALADALEVEPGVLLHGAATGPRQP